MWTCDSRRLGNWAYVSAELDARVVVGRRWMHVYRSGRFLFSAPTLAQVEEMLRSGDIRPQGTRPDTPEDDTVHGRDVWVAWAADGDVHEAGVVVDRGENGAILMERKGVTRRIVGEFPTLDAAKMFWTVGQPREIKWR